MTTYHLDENFSEQDLEFGYPRSRKIRMLVEAEMKLIPRDEVKEVLLVVQEVWLVARLVASWVHLSSTPAASSAEHMKI